MYIVCIKISYRFESNACLGGDGCGLQPGGGTPTTAPASPTAATTGITLSQKFEEEGRV